MGTPLLLELNEIKLSSSSEYSDLWSSLHIELRKQSSSVHLPVWAQSRDITVVQLAALDRNMTFCSHATFETSTHCGQSPEDGERERRGERRRALLAS